MSSHPTSYRNWCTQNNPRKYSRVFVKVSLNNVRKTKSEVCGVTFAAFHKKYNYWLVSR